MATPAGKRDDEWYKIPKRRKGHLTKGAKGHWYKPVATDKRDMGARKRNIFGKYASETAKPTDRNLFKGFGLAKGIYEQKETNYDSKEEALLFESKKEIADLISLMELKKNEAKAQ